jgi:hypothetical protein
MMRSTLPLLVAMPVFCSLSHSWDMDPSKITNSSQRRYESFGQKAIEILKTFTSIKRVS